jgi:hypothetical protein
MYFNFIIFPFLALLLLPWFFSLIKIPHVTNGFQVFIKQFLFWLLVVLVEFFLVYIYSFFDDRGDGINLKGGILVLVLICFSIFLGGMNTNYKMKQLSKPPNINSDLLDD